MGTFEDAFSALWAIPLLSAKYCASKRAETLIEVFSTPYYYPEYVILPEVWSRFANVAGSRRGFNYCSTHTKKDYGAEVYGKNTKLIL